MQAPVRPQHPTEFQIWYGHTFSPARPFVATVEPIDASPEERARNILCQKATLLIPKLFPDVKSSADLGVEFVGSGSFHDVVGFTIPNSEAATEHLSDILERSKNSIDAEKYVIRIPHTGVTEQDTDMRRDIAILRGLADKIVVTIPRVVAFDMATDNLLDAAYTVESRLPGRTLEDLVGNETNEAQNVHIFKQVLRLVENLAAITAPHAGWVAEDFGEGIDDAYCSSGIPMKMFDFPFDVRSLTNLSDRTPLTYMLHLVDLWVAYEHAHHPSEDNFASWTKIKAMFHSLQRHNLLGETFHLCHGDLASRNILGVIANSSSVNITGIVDWDFACFAPAFCAYLAPMDMWSGAECVAVEACTAELIDIFKDVASADYMRYAFSAEAKIARKIWYVLRYGMLGEERRWHATNAIWMWERLHPEDNLGMIR